MKKLKKIYIADDSIVARLFLSKIIEQIPDIEIVEFINGEDVLTGIKNKIPDLLILDSVMPKMDGLTVLQELKKLNLDIPIVYCTADIQSTTKEKATNLGITEFINKPFQKEIIFEKVNNILFNK